MTLFNHATTVQQTLTRNRIPFRVLALRTAISLILIQFFAGEATTVQPSMLLADAQATQSHACALYQAAHHTKSEFIPQ